MLLLNSKRDALIQSPLDVPGLEAWWDLSDPTLLSLSGDDVLSATDKSGNGHTLTSGAAKPQYTRKMGGRTVPDFNGTSTYMNNTDAALVDIQNGTALPMSLFAAYISDAEGDDEILAAWSNSGTPSDGSAHLGSGSTGLMNYIKSDGVSFPITSFGPEMHGYPAMLAIIDTGAIAVCLNNGEAKGVLSYSLGSVDVDGFNVSSSHFGTTRIGFWDGGIAEVLVYDRAVTESQSEAIHAYLANKYSLPVAGVGY